MMMAGWMPNCREVARALAGGELEVLPWRRRLLVRLHLRMCEHCGRFARQLGLISEALTRAWTAKPDPGTLDGAQRRILAALRKA